MRARLIIASAVAVFAIAAGSYAFGWAEGGATYLSDGGDPMDCPACHAEDFPVFTSRSGPHGGYSATTQKCEVCHTVHDAPAGGILLLPKPTVVGTCRHCHDGTGGYGVYGTIAARGLAVGADHSIETTNVVPGGDWATGGSSVTTFTGASGFLSCDDCHSPHASSVVATFSGERIRFHANDLMWLPYWSTDKLLKRKPTGATTSTAVYGSDWCLGCHKGRASGGPVHNHPVDSTISTATPFYYDRVAIVTTDTSLVTTYGTLGMLGAVPGSLTSAFWHNRGFVMPWPRTPQQKGHAPICQQCHEDSRIVGEPGAVVPARVYRYGDGQTSGDPGTDNPLFQCFPHETQNYRMLVEATVTAYSDNLCLNCHPLAQLP
ncbi:MAG: hypothetical protein N3B11_02985 [Coriobacteriia bacterium]|nr:hypothetical protein [Coriobacteriia bacterium]